EDGIRDLIVTGVQTCALPISENVLRNRRVLAVAGTHGKTTTTAMLAWILEHAGFRPGFLIGGVPENFGISARIGDDRFFVIEAEIGRASCRERGCGCGGG